MVRTLSHSPNILIQLSNVFLSKFQMCSLTPSQLLLYSADKQAFTAINTRVDKNLRLSASNNRGAGIGSLEARLFMTPLFITSAVWISGEYEKESSLPTIS